MCAHPAVKILPLFGLPHPLDVRGKDVKERTEHGVRLWPARMFGEQAVHDGGALNDEPGDVLQRVSGDETYVSTAPFSHNLIQVELLSVITRAKSL